MTSVQQYAYIETPPASGKPIESLSDSLNVSGDWHARYNRKNRGMLSDLWYRGVNKHFPHQVPGVYRSSFSDRAKRLEVRGGLEHKRLFLERYMISQFRTAGARFLEGYSATQIYFAAQHYGLPTRLLDWSTNPLAALFFACNGAPDEDGYVYAMDAGKIIPEEAEECEGTKLYQSIMTMRHRYVEATVDFSFWEEPDVKRNPFVLPVRPDIMPGRIGQQSACFTLHMHKALPTKNPTMNTMKVVANKKGSIREELHRVNINRGASVISEYVSIYQAQTALINIVEKANKRLARAIDANDRQAVEGALDALRAERESESKWPTTCAL